jgi:hypothetical protein
MAYDSQGRRAILFGGHYFQPARLGDTWGWDGVNWTQLDDIGPSPRSDTAVAYNATRRVMVLFGGTDGNTQLSDTWEWNGEDWTQVADGGPAARTGHAMVFDSLRNRVMLFGGEAGAQGVLGDTWEWDGSEWVQIQDTGPTGRQLAAMAFDATRNRAVLFGGVGASQTFGDTWEWDGNVSLNVWTQASSFGPPACLGATMIHTGQRALLYGGASAPTAEATLFSNSWEWDGAHWTIRQDMGPGPRSGHAMVFDSGRSRGVLFGGTAVPPQSEAPSALGDTWEQFTQVTQGTTGQPGTSGQWGTGGFGNASANGISVSGSASGLYGPSGSGST